MPCHLIQCVFYFPYQVNPAPTPHIPSREAYHPIVGRVLTILSFCMRLQASLDSASIPVTSHSVKFVFLVLFLTKLLPVQNVVFYLTFNDKLSSLQGNRFHLYAQRCSRRWLWCMRSPWRSCDRSCHSSYLSQVTLCPRRSFSSALFNSRLTLQHSSLWRP